MVCISYHKTVIPCIHAKSIQKNLNIFISLKFFTSIGPISKVTHANEIKDPGGTNDTTEYIIYITYYAEEAYFMTLK